MCTCARAGYGVRGAALKKAEKELEARTKQAEWERQRRERLAAMRGGGGGGAPTAAGPSASQRRPALSSPQVLA